MGQLLCCDISEISNKQKIDCKTTTNIIPAKHIRTDKNIIDVHIDISAYFERTCSVPIRDLKEEHNLLKYMHLAPKNFIPRIVSYRWTCTKLPIYCIMYGAHSNDIVYLNEKFLTCGTIICCPSDSAYCQSYDDALDNVIFKTFYPGTGAFIVQKITLRDMLKNKNFSLDMTYVG